MRWGIERAGLTPCGDVEVGGRIESLPFAVAAVDETYAIVASRSGVIGLDPVADAVRWDATSTNLHPNDAFVLDDPVRGGRVPMVAWSTPGMSASLRGPIRLLHAFSETGEVVREWSGDALSIGNATAMAASPERSDEALALNASVFSAAEVAVFGEGRRDPARIGPFTGGAPYTIHAGRTSVGARRVVWSSTVIDETTGARGAGVLTSTDPWSDDTLMLAGAGGCGEDECEPVHAVLDPSLEHGVLAVCAGAPPQLVRFDIAAGSCTVVAARAQLGELRLAYLSVLP